MRESSVERRCRDIAREAGGYLLKLWPAGMVGIPDRILLLPGARIMFIEFKSATGRVGPLQHHWLAVLRGLGFRAEVHRTVEEFRAALDSLQKRP